MEEIKSVRVRSKDGLDIKVTLYRDNQKRKIEGKGDGVTVFGLSEYGGNRYQNYTDDEIILDFIEVNRKSKQQPTGYYSIIQDPWLDTKPLYRSFGYDPYYLNNGTSVYINWLDDQNIESGGKSWSDENGDELDIKTGLTQSTKGLITKTVRISPPSDSGDKSLILKDSLISSEFVTGDKFVGTVKDLDIINQVISYWKIKIPNYNLEICSPNNEFCNIIPYKSPVQEYQPEQESSIKTEESEQGKETKIKLSVVLPEELELKVKQDLNGLKVYVGDPPPVGSGFIFQEDEFDNLDELDPEYTETVFDGLSEEEYNYQEDISNGQEDSSSTESSTVTEKVDIQPFGTFDELLRLAGKLARELGKNTRVNYSNLKQSYVKGVHGLCPQGTQAVLAALTGIKGLGKISGNADWFSFKTPGTGGGNASFNRSIDGVVYFNDKIKITQKNGSWKGTYLQDPSQWQVGDVIAMGYTGGKKYGHIQVWTGYKWMSDFKQNRIQQNNVDPNTVALWRLNENGLAAVRGQSGLIS